jgi:hypothetical protein
MCKSFFPECVCAVAALLVASAGAEAQSAQRFEAGGHVAVVRSGEFDAAETGIGGRLAWLPFELVGLETEVTLYPSDYPDGVAFSRGRWEALFGGTVGPRLGRFRPFAAVRAGVVGYREAPEAFACIAIYPPPLACTLAGGSTVPAIDLGGGVDVSVTDRSFFRLNVSGRAVRYEGPVLSSGFTAHDENFWSTGLRISAGGGWRF